MIFAQVSIDPIGEATEEHLAPGQLTDEVDPPVHRPLQAVPLPDHQDVIRMPGDMSETYEGFEAHDLEDGHRFFVGQLPEALRPDATGFEAFWAIHPDDYHVILMHGRPVKTPRWQQAYGADYHYTGRTNVGLPVPPGLEPFREWARGAVDERLNGLLLNWYDGELGHYIGPHHDSIKDLVPGAPIVTISLGEPRIFRLTPPRRKLRRDFPADDGTAFVMPYATNRAWKHSVPKLARYRDRRISLTLRAFQGATGGRRTTA